MDKRHPMAVKRSFPLTLTPPSGSSGRGKSQRQVSVYRTLAWPTPSRVWRKHGGQFSLSPSESTCLARQPRIRQERGIYPAGTPARQIRALKFQDPVDDQPSCGLKSALRSLAQRLRSTHTSWRTSNAAATAKPVLSLHTCRVRKALNTYHMQIRPPCVGTLIRPNHYCLD